MKKIGIFICNYNKVDFVVRCVQAIKEQTFQDFDLFVVDNASTDDSVLQLHQNYEDSVTILQNSENLGGSGGFGRAVRTALDMGYPYFMLIDNDAMLEKHVVEYLYDYMETHESVGICGAEILSLQETERIMDLGGRIDWESGKWDGAFGGGKDLKGRAVIDCDYVSSCSVMARTEAVQKFGGFPEENFIYGDDVEWCTRCWQAGYKVVMDSRAKAYHNTQTSTAEVRNMFKRYYWERNRYRFFTRYLPQDRLNGFFQMITREFFSKNYGAMHKKMYGTAFTEWNALDDFMHGITGKASEGKIVPYVEENNGLAERIRQANSVVIYVPGQEASDYACLNNTLRYISKWKKDARVTVTFQLEDEDQKEEGLILQVCEHVTKIKENILPRVYIDLWRNAVLNEIDYQYFTRFEQALANFQSLYRPLFEELVERLQREGAPV